MSDVVSSERAPISIIFRDRRLQVRRSRHGGTRAAPERVAQLESDPSAKYDFNCPTKSVCCVFSMNKGQNSESDTAKSQEERKGKKCLEVNSILFFFAYRKFWQKGKKETQNIRKTLGGGGGVSPPFAALLFTCCGSSPKRERKTYFHHVFDIVELFGSIGSCLFLAAPPLSWPPAIWHCGGAHPRPRERLLLLLCHVGTDPSGAFAFCNPF